MAPALNTPSWVPTMLSEVRMLLPSHTFGESIPPAVFVLLLALRLGGAEENKFTKFSNGFDATPALDAFKAGLTTGAHDKAIDDVC